MSELLETRPAVKSGRWFYLGGVSALALLITGLEASATSAEDSDRPIVWIELGGQLERADGTAGRFDAPFMHPTAPRPVLMDASPLDAQRPPRYSIGGNAKLALQPSGSDWAFSAAIRYGRSNGTKKTKAQEHLPTLTNSTLYKIFPSFITGPLYFHPTLQNYAQSVVKSHGSHVILDFSAGKDVGLGLLGRHAGSSVEVGARFAQFNSSATADIRARPDIVETLLPPFHISAAYTFHNYALTGQSARSFQGLGPSLSWNASAAVLGDPDSAELTFDWGVNAAVLFGRQKARVNHHTSAQHYHAEYSHPTPTPVQGQYTHYERLYQHGGNISRAHSVVAPNLGGFAGISFKFPRAKVSMGYRADFFFGAMDVGTDTRRTTDVGFHGPFATISVGLGG